MMTVGASVILISAVSAGHWIRVASLSLIVVFGVCGLVLGARGQKKPAQIVLIIGAWLGSVGGMASGGGTVAPVSIVFPLLIVFAAWVGDKVVLVLATATIAAFAGLAYAVTRGLLTVRYDIAPYQALTVQVVLLVGSTALAYYAAKSLRFHIEALNASRRALSGKLTELGHARSALEQLNTSLEQQVAERTADLQNLVAGLESFNRSVSHDLRGSLGGIGGLAQLANESLQRGDDALARRALPIIAEQAKNSSRLMTALLSLAKVGDAALQREVVDLRELVRQVVDQLVLEQGDKPMPQIEVAQDMPSVNADPELIKPVLANLIGNAIKFSRDAAAGRIQIGAGRADGGVTVHVRDNGVGFDAKAATRLFTPFVRLHETQFDGHGVGLSIVRRAVERHGGRVWAESQPGQGAVFSFSLPA